MAEEMAAGDGVIGSESPERAAYLECPHCKASLTDDQKAAMNARGLMVAPCRRRG